MNKQNHWDFSKRVAEIILANTRGDKKFTKRVVDHLKESIDPLKEIYPNANVYADDRPFIGKRLNFYVYLQNSDPNEPNELRVTFDIRDDVAEGWRQSLLDQATRLLDQCNARIERILAEEGVHAQLQFLTDEILAIRERANTVIPPMDGINHFTYETRKKFPFIFADPRT